MAMTSWAKLHIGMWGKKIEFYLYFWEASSHGGSQLSDYLRNTSAQPFYYSATSFLSRISV